MCIWMIWLGTPQRSGRNLQPIIDLNVWVCMPVFCVPIAFQAEPGFRGQPFAVLWRCTASCTLTHTDTTQTCTRFPTWTGGRRGGRNSGWSFIMLRYCVCVCCTCVNCMRFSMRISWNEYCLVHNYGKLSDTPRTFTPALLALKVARSGLVSFSSIPIQWRTENYGRYIQMWMNFIGQ